MPSYEELLKARYTGLHGLDTRCLVERLNLIIVGSLADLKHLHGGIVPLVELSLVVCSVRVERKQKSFKVYQQGLNSSTHSMIY